MALLIWAWCSSISMILSAGTLGLGLGFECLLLSALPRIDGGVLCLSWFRESVEEREQEMKSPLDYFPLFFPPLPLFSFFSCSIRRRIICIDEPSYLFVKCNIPWDLDLFFLPSRFLQVEEGREATPRCLVRSLCG